jgi:hypothetical protein
VVGTLKKKKKMKHIKIEIANYKLRKKLNCWAGSMAQVVVTASREY